ncbi:aldo/keto reductase [Sphingomonas sp.]|uniref:aldo/keto reductase n=1 Tax=Sphingomonas sp. TaxID=28214 RepID=UPI002ED80B33
MTDITLNDGRIMPALGMGTYKVPDSQAAMVVRAGVDTGFRLVDTAAFYHNERGVGEGLRGSDAFVTTKLWNDRHEDAEVALDESLALLGRDSVDLYLIHWPSPTQGKFVSAWKTLVKLRESGKAKSIGVSNFLARHLERVIDATGVVPAVNQIELHPRFQQVELRSWMEESGIVAQSWSPLGQGDILSDSAIVAIARKHGRSPAQVVIAWHLALGLSVIPKAGSPDHLAENAAAAALVLDEEDMAAIAALDSEDGRIGPDPMSM